MRDLKGVNDKCVAVKMDVKHKRQIIMRGETEADTDADRQTGRRERGKNEKRQE